MQKILMFILLCGLYLSGYSQKKPDFVTELEKKAEEHLYNGEYRLAWNKYYKLFQHDSTDLDYNYKLCICAVEECINPEKTLEMIKMVKQKDPENVNANYYLARAYMMNYQFTEAIETFLLFKQLDGDKELEKRTDHWIESANHGIELLNKPVNVVFENLGSGVNSRLDDYNPFVNYNEGFIVFTSNKKYDPDYGTYISNVYTSESKRKEWGQAVNQAKINTYDNEETVFMAPDGNTLLLCNSMDNEYSDILIAERKGNMFRYNTKYDDMFKVLNTKTVENGAAISEECSSYFISGKRDGGYGGSDIYIIRKLPNGEWGQPENLGDNINTEYDEAYPNISPGGNVLYFASKGHNSIGGYDLFMSYWNIPRQEWTEPINLGYPINTTEDNTTISFTGNKRYAYIAARRKEGLGGLDIYRITFQDVEKEYTLMKGSIYLGDSINATPLNGDNSDLEITVYDEHGNIYGQYLPKNNTGQFVAILPIGEFELSVTYSDGYHEFDDRVEIVGKSGFKKEFDKNIYLKPIN